MRQACTEARKQRTCKQASNTRWVSQADEEAAAKQAADQAAAAAAVAAAAAAKKKVRQIFVFVAAQTGGT